MVSGLKQLFHFKHYRTHDQVFYVGAQAYYRVPFIYLLQGTDEYAWAPTKNT